MDKKVLLLGDSNSFMVGAIEKELIKARFKVTRAEIDEESIKAVGQLPELFIMYLEREFALNDENLIYINNLLKDDMDRLLYLVGSDKEVNSLKPAIEDDLISGIFKRPINIKNLTVVLEEVMDKRSKIEEKKRILVCDDDGTMLRTMKSWLNEKYQVFMVNSGMSAITFLATNKVDLILLDYEMPVISGAKVYEMIKSEKDTANIPVMFLTAKSDKDSVMEVLSLNPKPEAYLLKSQSKEVVLSSINDFFEKQRREKFNELGKNLRT
ncbi:response regulator [Lachnospira sp.]|jgi:CheY-like chemotaxis protein|uniref:response regulator n=1 Tax=Lachnospira sp. TaxID=2049031 RepID=UPI00257D63A3|nr:response regulator [Lachnospira sp.]